MAASILNGIFIGIVYGLFAVGLVLIYRASRVVNFAQGTIGTLGALFFSVLWVSDKYPLLLALAIAVIVSGATGVGFDFLVVRPLRGHPPILPTLASFGMAALVFSYASRRFGSLPVATQPLLSGQGPTVWGLVIEPDQLLMAAASLLALIGLTVVIHHTKFGLSLRAAAQDAEIAEQIGIRVNLVSLIVWFLASALSAICGILLASQVALSVSFMTALTLRGMVAALVGGLTSIIGAFAAGIALGVIESVLQFKIAAPGATEAVLALIVIVTLLIRPTGLRGAEY